MADKTINDLTATTTVASGDLFEMENTGNNSRKITAANLAAGLAALGGGGLTLISSVTTSGSQASVTFSSIAGTYDALLVRVIGRSNAAGTDNDPLLLQINGDTGSNYSWARDGADNSAAFSSGSGGYVTSATIGYLCAATSTTSAASFVACEIPLYAGTSWCKNGWAKCFGKGGSYGVYQMNLGMYWNSTAAITSILVKPSASTFVDGSVVELVGINY